MAYMARRLWVLLSLEQLMARLQLGLHFVGSAKQSRRWLLRHSQRIEPAVLRQCSILSGLPIAAPSTRTWRAVVLSSLIRSRLRTRMLRRWESAQVLVAMLVWLQLVTERARSRFRLAFCHRGTRPRLQYSIAGQAIDGK